MPASTNGIHDITPLRLADFGYLVLLPDMFYRIGVYEPFDGETLFTDPVQRDLVAILADPNDQPSGGCRSDLQASKHRLARGKQCRHRWVTGRQKVPGVIDVLL